MHKTINQLLFLIENKNVKKIVEINLFLSGFEPTTIRELVYSFVHSPAETNNDN